jgi:hypothetical protein
MSSGLAAITNIFKNGGGMAARARSRLPPPANRGTGKKKTPLL